MDQEFRNAIRASFVRCLGTSVRSNEKLKILHGFIADDLRSRLGNGFAIKSLGHGDGKEATLQGRYMTKCVDISIFRNDTPIAALGVKFVMSNYGQNSNNYFEGMLGETANLRAGGIPYYQILVLPSSMPYFSESGSITKWEVITTEQLKKYAQLSLDDVQQYIHTPVKTLVYLVDIPKPPSKSSLVREGYRHYYIDKSDSIDIQPATSTLSFGGSVLFNDYEGFARILHVLCR